MPEDNKKSTYAGFTDARRKANAKYMEKFVEIKVRVTPDQRNLIKEYAEKQGESLNSFVLRAINETMQANSAK